MSERAHLCDAVQRNASTGPQHRTLCTLGPENAVPNMDLRCPRCGDILVPAGLGVPIALGEALGAETGEGRVPFDAGYKVLKTREDHL